MRVGYLPLLIVAAAVPAGWLAALLVRQFAVLNRPAVASIIVTSMLLALWATMVMPSLFLLAITLVLAWALLVLGATDLLVFRLPDLLTLPLIGAGLLLSFWLPDADPAAHFAGGAIGFAALYGVAVAYRRARGHEGLGLGDAKLAAAAGAWLGWRALPSLLLLACAVGFIAVGIGVARRGKRAMRDQIAFGVPLCLAFWIVWLYGPLSF